MQQKFILNDLSVTNKLAKSIAHVIPYNFVITLSGNLGAGKTTLTREVLRCLGVTGSIKSPTFTLVNEYATEDGSPIFHFDFYRLDKPEEAFDIGVEEYFYSGELCLIEWPEKIEQILPDDCLKVQISVLDNGFRKLVF